jgi:hypothetical protein
MPTATQTIRHETNPALSWQQARQIAYNLADCRHDEDNT